MLKEFVKGESVGAIRGGVLDGGFLESAEVEALADLPPREALLARLLGALQGPVAGLPRTLNGVLGQLVNVMDAIAKKKESA